MPDYKQMYIKMAQEAEKAIRILIAAQQDCENLSFVRKGRRYFALI